MYARKSLITGVKNYACSKECKSVWFSDKEIKQPIKRKIMNKNINYINPNIALRNKN